MKKNNVNKVLVDTNKKINTMKGGQAAPLKTVNELSDIKNNGHDLDGPTNIQLGVSVGGEN